MVFWSVPGADIVLVSMRVWLGKCLQLITITFLGYWDSRYLFSFKQAWEGYFSGC